MIFVIFAANNQNIGTERNMKSFLFDMLRADSDRMAASQERRVANITIIRNGFFAGSMELKYDSAGRLARISEMRANGVAQHTELVYEGERIRVSRYDESGGAACDQCVMEMSAGRTLHCDVVLNMSQQTVSEKLDLHYDSEGHLTGFLAEADHNGRSMNSEMRMFWQDNNLVKVENLIGDTVFSKCEFSLGRTINPTGNLLTAILLADDLCDVFMNFGCASCFGRGPRNMIKRCVTTKYEGGAAHSTIYEVAYHRDGYLKRIKKTEDGSNPKLEYTVLVFDWE